VQEVSSHNHAYSYTIMHSDYSDAHSFCCPVEVKVASVFVLSLTRHR
jgi:hypothetical protein